MLGFVREEKSRQRISELEEELENKKEEIRYINKRFKTLHDSKEEMEDEYERALDKRGERIKVLEGLHEKTIQLQKQEIELDTKEAILASQAHSIEDTRKELDRRKADYETELEVFKQSYYADGLADGLRKAHEITAEDRKQTAQIAALAAASHTPAAAEQIAGAVSQNLLNSGQANDGKRTKKNG